MTDITMREMLEAGVHFGHQTRYWNPQMAPYIYGARHKIHIINLEESLPRFRDAIKFIGKVASNKGKVLFVGTKYAAREIVREEATRCGMPYVDYRWLGGMLTNYKTIRQSIKRLKDLELMLDNEKTLDGKTKKEVLTLMREKDKLSSCLEGIKNMGSLPDVIFVIDVGHEQIAIKEAQRLGIPVVGIVDTNSDPRGIDMMIPGNDDALRSIRLYCKTLADTIIEARGAVEIEEAKRAKEAPKVAKAPAPQKVVTKKAAAQPKAEPAAAEVPAEAAKAPAKKKVVRVKKEAAAEEAAPAKKKAAAKKAPAKKKPADKKAPGKKKAPVKKAPSKKKPAAKKTAAKKDD